jgi:ABC-type transport system involved in multi-copper enzyme maturation permease subunit
MNPLWITQVLAVLRLEMRKTFFSKRGFWIYLLALMPVVLFTGKSIVEMQMHRSGDFGEDTNIFATTFQLFYLRLAVFFGCLGIFMNLFRGEVLDKSLHYYFLAPIRREVLLAGKFLAGVVATCLIFTTSTALQIAGLYWEYGWRTFSDYLMNGNGLSHIAAYLGATVLACIGYGSIFLAAGVVFRNPLIPAAVILVWESINSFLPSILQKLSVIYYLKSLCPIQIVPEAGTFFSLLSINTDPLPAYIAVPGLLLVAAAVLVAASFQVRRMEINYATE